MRVLLAVFFLRGLGLICLLPPGEMWDEYAHLAYVDHWSRTGRVPVYGRDDVDPRLLAAVAALPQPPAVTFGRTYAAFWAGLPAPPLPAACGLYEAQHPFPYYAAVAPVYRLCGGAGHLITTVAVLRLLNLGCGLAAMSLILRWLRHSMPGPAALAIGCWVTLQPLLLLNVVRVANDAVAFLLGTAVVVLALDLGRSPRRRTAALAVVLPLAVLAKLTNAALVPAVAVALVVATTRGLPRRTAWAAAFTVAAATAAALVPYAASNLRAYGLVAPMTEAVVNHAAGRSVLSQVRAVPVLRWPVWTATWWVTTGLWVGGWSFLRPPRPLEPAYAVLLASAAVVTVRRWRTLPGPASSRVVMLAVVGWVQIGLMVHAAASYSAWQGRMFTNAWYAAVAVPWMLVLLGGGATAIRRRRLRVAVLLGVPAVFVAAEAYGTLCLMPSRYYAAPPLSPTALWRMAGLHPVALGRPTFILAVLATGCLLAALGRQLVRVAAGPPEVTGSATRSGGRSRSPPTGRP